ncbi:cation exporting V-type ATPase, subunit C [Alteracholeplasma palmae J233]|uniref:Cation exporting V-type ATPase, subunit C n=1 Tax=Alteracholeplasma palmae (strain ATCC 49389 / J233) TaxID=1318466 RepID=U4KKD3_ALTPJ|nr:V-type ATPase subunit [Alteracholeplasma palmae]CCV64003.1 cation exporting V-type ATPase, subunit C [Alteracholeplasma palmae J233]
MLLENALVTKARAIYGKLLNEDDFTQLVKKKSVEEVASYLRSHPFYLEAFSGVSDQNLNRKRLEETIKKYHFSQVLKLIRYSAAKYKSFYQIDVIHKEHDIILSMIKSFISDESYDVINDLPIFFDQYSKLDLLQISKSKNLSDLVDSLKETSYYKLLLPYKEMENTEIKYNQFESVLEQKYFEFVNHEVEKNFKGSLKKQLKNIMKTKTDLSTVIKIYRLKKYYEFNDDEIKAVIVNKYNTINENKLNAMLSFENPDDLLKIYSKGKYDGNLSSANQYIENYMDTVSYQLAKKTLLYSKEAPLVYLAYLTISNTQIDNLIHIIEGIRYNVPENEIKEIIIV